MKKILIAIACIIACIFIVKACMVKHTVCPKCGSHNLIEIEYNHGERSTMCEDCGYAFLIG